MALGPPGPPLTRVPTAWVPRGPQFAPVLGALVPVPTSPSTSVGASHVLCLGPSRKGASGGGRVRVSVTPPRLPTRTLCRWP